MYHSYSEITNPSDRMRWCRYSLGLLQKDVAAMVGMEEWLYQDLESGAFQPQLLPGDCGQAGCLLFHPGQRPSG